MYHRLILVFFLMLTGILRFSESRAQGFYTDFGKNRVQYHDFIWSYYESSNFMTYFYQGGHDIAKFTVQYAEQSIGEIESRLEYPANTKIEIMLYHNLSDLKQSNIGLGIEQNNTGGVTKIIGNKIFIHFDGNFKNLERKIREGIARVLVQKMVFGSTIQEILQNAVLLNLPDWYVNGLVAYIGRDWDTELDNRLRRGMLNNEFERFDLLTGENATFAGHALWYYISQVNGPTAIPNLLYLTRINRSVESGFLFVLGNTVKGTIQEFNDYYRTQFLAEKNSRISQNPDEAILKTSKKLQRRNVMLDEVKVSPNGRYIAYTTSEIGKHLVYLFDTQENKKQVILRNGFKSHSLAFNDRYPLLAWDQKSEQLAVVFERRDQIKFLLYNPTEKTQTFTNDITKFQQVTGIAFTNDPNKMVFSAVQNGQPDIFMYYIPNTKVTKITDDFYSDLQPSYIKLRDKEGLLFISNRNNDTLKTEKMDTILPLRNFDVYFYDLKTPDRETDTLKTLVRVTDTPFDNEWLPIQYDSTHFTFLSDMNGIKNQYVAYFDSIYLRTDSKVFFKDSTVLNPSYPLDSLFNIGLIDTIIKTEVYKTISVSFPVSNFSQSNLETDVAVKSGEQVQLFFDQGQYQLYKKPLSAEAGKAKVPLSNTPYRLQLENREKARIKNKEQKEALVKQTPPISVTEAIKAIPDNSQQQQPTKMEVQEPVVKPIPSDTIDIENYFFQSEFDYYNTKETVSEKPAETLKPAPATVPAITGKTTEQTEPQPVFRRTAIRQYFTQFYIDQIATQLDNTIIYTPYENFSLSPVTFSMPDLGGLFKLGITDLMEDNKIIGGFRIPLGLGGSEYFLEYRALRKRLDKKIFGYRKAIKNNYTINNIPDTPEFTVTAKNITNILQYSLSYPFDINTSLRGHIGLRHDRIVFLASDRISLLLPDIYENWLYAKTEYVFDNTLDVAMNILNGTRYKVYAEVHKAFEGNISDRDVSFKFKDTGWMGIVGADARHYTRVHKQIVWANRVASAMSFGTKKMVYYLGGVENWMIFNPEKQFDSNTPVDLEAGYAFKGLATNMRGFKQNIRNGTSYLVLNSELRIPVISYLSPAPIRSELLRNFQIIAFADAGTAWEGISPFDEDNQYSVVTIGTPPVEAVVKYFRNPVVAGYGLGVRTKLLGYFTRLDVAWGLDSGARTPAQWYFSMGLDF
ncbi:MAG: hypothetical protein IPM47_05360 [Sphingobacteriales bacterium]|nr:MAG: hypothetical protein IPM47_05360 [Sphingobacteriales bacterium]